ncbi:MAG: hypothetical protein A3B38_04295 [Candidatus Levybacteria bacterium RIFCSPLOWO2_01_FULL_36_13]|nr:MAG: hypothetical protein A2684_01220 [Candidatus Levybacteria bacterium RIFCSPHIGHO2_01_FULL_36_15b]OGH34347.1 MAG: hypothetical protein A3B38_04295 [Candidatus Levybacteria bacterium RIFCSPLOWO2_01_FULL_36_13]
MEREQTENLKYNFSVKMAGEADLKYVPEISGWTNSAGTMIALSEEKLAELFLNDNSAIVTNSLGQIVSHAAITCEYLDDFLEFGGLVTGKDFQNHGAATLVTKFLLCKKSKENPGKTIFALANNISSKILIKLNAPEMLTTEVCEQAWDLCKECPKYMKPKSGEIFECCDTPYNLTEVCKGGDKK